LRCPQQSPCHGIEAFVSAAYLEVENLFNYGNQRQHFENIKEDMPKPMPMQ
jgi:hypothetical protein